MNGVSLLGASHVEAVRALRSAPEKLYITVCDGYDPNEVLRRKSEAVETAESKSEADTIDRGMLGYLYTSNVIYIYFLDFLATCTNS